MDDLTIQDIELLIESVKAWQANSGKMIGAIFGAMLGPKPSDPSYTEFKRQQEDGERKEKREQTIRDDRAVMLHAKLIGIRNRIEAGKFVDSAVGNTAL